ncbi:hypothetical protein vseg_009113 [Gypsophila vaccaria]
MPDNSGTKISENRIHLFDPVALISDGYKSSSSSNVHVSKPRRPTKPYGNLEDVEKEEDDDMKDEIRFEVDEQEASTPRLWKTSRTTQQSCRTMEIAQGRRELMDMVKDLPESFYELSLKDIVEHNADLMEEQSTMEETMLMEKKMMKMKRLARSKSVEKERVMLKTTMFPSFFGAKKKKAALYRVSGGSFKVGTGTGTGTKPNSSASNKGEEKDWWRMKLCMSNGSDESNGLSSKSGSGGSSSSSSNSNSNSNSSSILSSNSVPRCITSFSTICCLFNGKNTSKQ